MHRVGLIGLGKMGLPIARNLMERGFEVTGYRRSGSPELAGPELVALVRRQLEDSRREHAEALH